MKTTRTTARRRPSKQVPGAETPHAPVVIDIDGLSLDADDRRRLRHPLTGGLILFARNWQDRHQLTELTAEIKSIRPDVLICVDHEGMCWGPNCAPAAST